jgi:hypothetical protein
MRGMSVVGRRGKGVCKDGSSPGIIKVTVNVPAVEAVLEEGRQWVSVYLTR